jgi:hypothetical protein
MCPRSVLLRGSVGLTRLACVQHARQGGLLSGRDGQVVDVLDLDPHLGIGAVVGSWIFISINIAMKNSLIRALT